MNLIEKFYESDDNPNWRKSGRLTEKKIEKSN
jgi:hypothetical protein